MAQQYRNYGSQSPSESQRSRGGGRLGRYRTTTPDDTLWDDEAPPQGGWSAESSDDENSRGQYRESGRYRGSEESGQYRSAGSERYGQSFDPGYGQRYGQSGGGYGGGDFGNQYQSQQGGQAFGRSQGQQQFGGSTGYRGKGPKGYQRSDERLKEIVCERLTEDDSIDASSFTIAVKNGEVTLDGTVRDRQTKHRAEDLIENCGGVKDIHNNLRVERSFSGSESSREESGGSSKSASASRSGTGTQTQ